VKIFIRALACSAVASSVAYGQVVASELLKPENRTVSTSKQITVFGGTREVRSDLTRRAEQLREGLRQELNLTDNWSIPVLVTLTPQDGLRLRQPRLFAQVFDAGDAGRKLQLDLSPGVLADPQLVDDAFLRSLLLEISLRRQKFTGSRYVEPPSWLVGAMSSALSRRESGEQAQIYSALLGATKGMPKLDRFLRQDAASLRGRTREIHEAQSQALYRSLLELPQGRAKIVENLTLAEPARDAVERFAQTWPELAEDPARLSRLWALGMARLSSPSRVEYFSSEETARQLSAVLDTLGLGVPPEEGGELLLAEARTEEGRFRFEKASADLRNLGFRSHPLYAALVEEYRSLFDDLGRGRRRGAVSRFTECEDLRVALDGRSAQITDFLNWYQANAVEAAPALSVRPALTSQPADTRNDALTRYLDSIEQRGW